METLNRILVPIWIHQFFLTAANMAGILTMIKKLYGVPQCFQKPTFKLDDAIKIIEYKKKMKEQQIENKKDFHDDNDILKQLDKEPNGVSEDGVYSVVNKIKNKKKF